MLDMTDPKRLSMVVPGPRLDDAEYCRRKASKHRDRHLGMLAMAEHEVDPNGVEFWLSEAAYSLRHVEWWEARAEEAEEKANG